MWKHTNSRALLLSGVKFSLSLLRVFFYVRVKTDRSAHHYVLFYPGNNCTVTKDITFHPFHGGGIIVKVSKISVFQYRLEDEVIT